MVKSITVTLMVLGVSGIIALAVLLERADSDWGALADRTLFTAGALAGLGALCVTAITAYVAMAFLQAVQKTTDMAERQDKMANRLDKLEGEGSHERKKFKGDLGE